MWENVTPHLFHAAIYTKYVDSNKYPYNRFQPNFKKLLNDFREKIGPFDPKLAKADVPKWYTSKTEQSDGYILLMYLRRHRKDELINMTAKQIWEAHPAFQQYTILEKFKEYNYK